MCRMMMCVGKPYSLKQIENFYARYGRSNPHASGYALFHNNSVLINKQPLMGSELFENDKKIISETLPNTKVGLFHVRFATHGSPQNNKNNHPIYHSINGKMKSMIIHNGIVYPGKKFVADGETDTEQILSGWDQEGPECLAQFSGYAAVAVIENGKVYIYRHLAPLFYKQTEQGIYIHQNANYHHVSVPENIVFEVSIEGLAPVAHVEMQTYHIVQPTTQRNGWYDCNNNYYCGWQMDDDLE